MLHFYYVKIVPKLQESNSAEVVTTLDGLSMTYMDNHKRWVTLIIVTYGIWTSSMFYKWASIMKSQNDCIV